MTSTVLRIAVWTCITLWALVVLAGAEQLATGTNQGVFYSALTITGVGWVACLTILYREIRDD